MRRRREHRRRGRSLRHRLRAASTPPPLIGAGVTLILAETFAATHRRNLVNEGFATLVVTDPAFRALVEAGATLRAEIATGIVTHVESGRSFRGSGPKGVAADILAAGGIVPMVLASREQVRA